MYVTEGLYKNYAEYIDLKDDVFFHQAIELAKERYYRDQEIFNEMTDEDFKKLKQKSIVVYASTVSNFTNDDILILRPEMNERARRKYLIIDADFKENETEESNELVQNLKQLAADLQTPLIIYPTMSYPSKPRFRAVLFVKNQLSEATYHQAISWLYFMLGVKATDDADYKIRSNNNAPFFVNQEQIDFIYDTTTDETLKPLDNSLWRSFDKPRVSKTVVNPKNALDESKISDELLKQACVNFANSETAKQFSTFWRLFHSLARAEYFGQLTESQIDKALEWVACVPGHEADRARWMIDNKTQYKHEKRRVFNNERLLLTARPIVNVKEFGNVFLEDDSFQIKG